MLIVEATMIDDLVSVVLEEFLGEAFGGLFYRAPNRHIRRLKFLTWTSLIASIGLIVSAFALIPQRFVPAAFLAGFACAILFFVFGIWTAFERRRLEERDD